jgi:hypothetical protein
MPDFIINFSICEHSMNASACQSVMQINNKIQAQRLGARRKSKTKANARLYMRAHARAIPCRVT